MALDVDIFRHWADTGSYAATARYFDVPPAAVKKIVASTSRNFAHADEGEFAHADPGIGRLLGTTPFNPNEIIRRQGYGVIRDMRRDDQVKAALNFKKNTIVAPGWQVVSPQGEDEDWEVRRFIEQQLLELPASFNDCLKAFMTAFDFGYSVTEKVFKRIEDGEFAGKVGLAALKPKHPQWIDFDVDPFGNLRPDGIIQKGRLDGVKRFPVGKFVVYVHQMEFSNPYGKPDLDSTYKAWWAKANAYRWLLMLLEKFGIPPVFALYNPQAYSPAQQNSLLTTLRDIQAGTSGIIPRLSKESLELWSPELASQASRVFVPAINMFDTHIARSVLMPGLLGLTPEQSVGSLARARVHFDVFLQVVQEEEKRLEETAVDEQIIRPLVDLNFVVEKYPKFKFLPLTEDIKADTMKAWVELLGAGAVKQQDEDEGHIRQILDFPAKGEEDEDGLGPKPEPEEEPVDDEPPGGEPPISQSFQLSRPKNKFERNVDFRRIDRDLNQLQADALEEIVPLMVVVRERFLKFHAGGASRRSASRSSSAGPRFDGKPSTVVKITQLSGIQAVREAFGRFLEAGMNLGFESVQRELSAKFQEDPNFRPEAAARFLRAKTFWITGVVEDGILGDARNVLLRSIETGELQRETAQKLRDVFEPYVGDPGKIRDGKVVSAARLETIIRTNATDSFNRGRIIEARQSGDLLQGFSYSAIIDERTTEVCEFLDGRVFRADDPNIDSLKPPRHFNCRSILVPQVVGTTIEEKDILTKRQAARGEELSGKGFK